MAVISGESECAQRLGKIASHRRAVFDQAVIVEYIDCLAGDGGREWIAAEGAAVVTGRKSFEDVAACEKGRHRVQAAAERLAEHQSVGTDCIMIAGQERARSAEAGLNLIADQASTSCCRQISAHSAR